MTTKINTKQSTRSQNVLKITVFNDLEVQYVDYKGARFFPLTYSMVDKGFVWLSFARDEHAVFFQHALCFEILTARNGASVRVARESVSISRL